MWNIGQYVCFDAPHQNGILQRHTTSARNPNVRSLLADNRPRRRQPGLLADNRVSSQTTGSHRSQLVKPSLFPRGKSLSRYMTNVEHWSVRMF